MGPLVEMHQCHGDAETSPLRKISAVVFCTVVFWSMSFTFSIAVFIEENKMYVLVSVAPHYLTWKFNKGKASDTTLPNLVAKPGTDWTLTVGFSIYFVRLQSPRLTLDRSSGLFIFKDLLFKNPKFNFTVKDGIKLLSGWIVQLFTSLGNIAQLRRFRIH